MTFTCFHVKNTSTIDEAWQELEDAGCQPLYSDESPDGDKKIYGLLPQECHKKKFKTIGKVEDAVMPNIDWEAQWTDHGHDFHDGYVHIDLKDFGFQGQAPILRLEPGPGFGDFSHPTTRLALKLMADKVKDHEIVDIGSGSGILSIAAVLMGAKKVHGVDIDVAANEHAVKNAALNKLKKGKVSFGLPESLKKVGQPLLIVMNMIMSEQLVAWESLRRLHDVSAEIIVSGILVEEFDAYLKQTKKWGWKLKNKKEEASWLGLCFNKDVEDD